MHKININLHNLKTALIFSEMGSKDPAFLGLTMLNKRACARCEMYTQSPGAEPKDVPN